MVWRIVVAEEGGETCEKNSDGLLRVRIRVAKTKVDAAFPSPLRLNNNDNTQQG